MALAAEISEIIVTYATREAAEAAARQLVENRLAACVQVEGPVSSTYWWEGKAVAEPEWRLSAKTAADGAERAADALIAGHPYDLPGLVVQTVRCTKAFADWVRAETRA